jgi:hypothetical protein
MTAMVRRLGLSGLLVLVAACTGPAAIPLHDNDATHGGAVPGTLVSRDGCLLLEIEGGTVYGVAWPADATEWDPRTGTIRVHDVEASVGDEVVLGGAVYEITPTTVDTYEWTSRPRDECLGDGFVISGGMVTDFELP